MIFILEGPDGSGKTTLAKTLEQQTGFMYLHRSNDTDADHTSIFDEYMQVIKAGKNVIIDRAWYSEMVYGPVLRDGSAISYVQMYELERAMTRHGGILIYCTGPMLELHKRCLRRGEDLIVDAETYRRVYTAYEDIMSKVPHIIPVVTYEYKR